MHDLCNSVHLGQAGNVWQCAPRVAVHYLNDLRANYVFTDPVNAD